MQCIKCGNEVTENAKFCPSCGSTVNLAKTIEFNTVREALSEKYEVLREIGRGGMAAVYEAVDKKLGRHIAVKVLLLSFADDKVLQTRFLQEARRGANLKHPGIVTIYDADQKGDVSYFAMELLDGIDLEQRIKNGGVLSLKDAADILKKVAEALEYAHSQGLVHRDVKPSNVFLANDGRVLLMDFGICRDTSGSNLTQTGTSMGTPEYMSPEQVEGRPDIDARTDIYSLGIIFFQMLTGKVPFSATTPMAVAMKQLSESIPLATSINKNLPDNVDNIISRSTAKDRNQRYCDTREMIADVIKLPSEKPASMRVQANNQISPTMATPISQSFAPVGSYQSQKSSSGFQLKPIYIAIIAIVCIGILGYVILNKNKGNNSNEGEKSVDISDSDKKEITDIIQNWANAWSSKDFIAYKTFYAMDFYGVKRVKTGKATSYSYDSWMLDRNKMLSKAAWTTVEVNNIVFRKATEKEVEVEFEQTYRSNSYSDRGQKILRFRRDESTWKIIYEELLYATQI